MTKQTSAEATPWGWPTGVQGVTANSAVTWIPN